METVKEIWTSEDFEEMDWHDCYIYSIHFPPDEPGLTLDIDFLIASDLDKDQKFYTWWIAPCTLTFHCAWNIKISLDLRKDFSLEILELNRTKPTLTSSGKMGRQSYRIVTDLGTISFTADGFTQTARKKPIQTRAQRLELADRE